MCIIEKSLIYHHTRLIDVQDVYYENEIQNLQYSIDTFTSEDQLANELFRYRISLSKIFLNYKNLKVFHITKHPNLVNCVYEWNLKNDNNNLTNLSLMEIKIVNDDQMTDALLSTLIEKCPRLETIRIVNCFNINGDFLFYVISKNLKNLTLDRCTIVSLNLNLILIDQGDHLNEGDLCVTTNDAFFYSIS